MRFLVALIAVLAWGCSQSDPELKFEGTLFGVTDAGPLGVFAETTPVIFQNKLLFVVAHREANPGGTSIAVIDETGVQLGTGPSDMGLASAIVYNGRLYVFGTTAWDKQNHIRMSSTDDMANWTEPVIVLSSIQGQSFYNTSVAETDGGFVMAYEVCESGRKCFTFRTAVSQDLINWKKVGEAFHSEYTACPTIRYYDGQYYVFFLVMTQGQFVTAAAKSKDLIRWDWSRLSVLSPANSDVTSKNTSDLDFVELNGKLEMVYINGDQVSWGHTRRAQFNGTEKDLYEALF